MSNVTITKSSPADYVDNPRNDTRRTTLDAATDYRPVAPVRRDWQSIAANYAGAAGLLLIVALLYGIFRLALCWGSYSETCENWRWLEAWAPWYALIGIVIALVVRGVAWCFRASNTIAQGRIENERFSLLPDQFGIPFSSKTYQNMTPQEIFDSYYKLLSLAVDLKRDTAPYEVYPGSLNTLSIGGNSQTLALPESIEGGLTLTPDDQWRKWLLKAPHLLIGGKTDAGKTTFEQMLLAEYIDNGDQVLILDPHWQPGKWFGLPATSGIPAILSLLPDLLDELTSRLEEYKAGKLTEEFDRLTILIDEVPAIVSECIELTASGRPRLIDDRWPRFARRLGSEARKVGCRVILGSQSTLVQDLLINDKMKENYTRIGLGNQARPLLSGEADNKRKQSLHDLLRGQSHPAAMEYRGDYYVLDTSNVVALAERPIRPLARVWGSTTSARTGPAQELLGALLNGHAVASVRPSDDLRTSVKPPSNTLHADGRTRTDDGRVRQERIKLYLTALARQGKSREYARQWAESRDLQFENKLWTEIRRELGLL